MLALHRLALRCFALVCLSAALPHAQNSALAQNIAPKPLIVEKVNESQLVRLEGNTPPAAIAQNDRGRVSSDLRMDGLILVLRRSPEQQAAFDTFVANQYDATSPNYHHWLAPEEVGEKFGSAPADIATVSSWLSSHGLSVDGVSKDRMTIRFSGSAAQVEEAFHTEIHNLMVKGEAHISNMSDPQIPMALEPVVLGPKALHNFTPRPLHRTGSKVMLNGETGKWERVATPAASAAGLRPDLGFTTCGTSSCLVEDVAPYDFAAIYNVLPLWNSSIDGTGQTIAIAGRSDVRAADVAKFRSTFGLTGGAFNLIKNGTDPGFCTGTSGNCTLDDQIENALDVEWSGAVAKGATVDLVVTQQTNSNDAIYDSAQYVINNSVAPILNVSYGQCELFLGTSGNTAYNGLWQSAATQGIAVFVATGDSGAPSCDQGAASSGPYGAQFGTSVSGLASSQYDTAVGGTDLNWGTTTAPYWNTTNNGTNGSTAKGYIPEVPWNDSCTNPIVDSILNGELGQSLSAVQMCDYIATHQVTSMSNEQGLLDLVNVIGGGGGASNCTTNGTTSTTTTPNPATCSGGYAEPSWQQTVFTGTGSHRMIPDVSFFAGNGFLGSAYLICVSDWGTCLTSATTTSEPAVGEIGGTSAASPAMAGVMALINQKVGLAQGNPNSELYTLAGKQTYSSCSTETVNNSSSCYFNDIDTGTNDMPCAAGSPGCFVPLTTYTIGVFNYFDAGVGYDLASGLGSLNVANVANGWSAATGTAIATVTASASPSSITSAQGTTVTVAVTGASGTPTGTVVLTSGAFTSATKSLSGGTVTFTVTAGQLAVGADSVKANYSGDATYAAASGTTTVTVTKLTAAVTVVPAQSAIESNVSLTVTGAVSGSGVTPTGTVTLSGGGFTSPAATLSGGNYSITIPANSLSGGADTLTVSYSGDSVYTTASNSAVVTVTTFVPLTPTVTVTPASASIGTGQTLNVTATVTGSGATPTGTVTLSGGGYTSSAHSLSAGTYTFAIPANSLSAGSDSLAVSYGGDSNYATGTGSASVTVTPSVFTLAATTPANINRGTSASSTITWNTTTNYSGTVTLSSCTLNSGAPANSAADTPACSVSTAAIAMNGTGTATVTTKAATTAMLTRPEFPQRGIAIAGSGAILALTVFFGIPARRRSWRVMLGMFLLLMTLGSLAACGGGGGSSGGGGGGTSDPGTASGQYVFTVTGTGNPAVTPAPTKTFTVTVN